MKWPTITWQSDLALGIALAAVFAVAGAIIGLLLIPSSPKAADPNAPAPEFLLLGQHIPATPDAPDRALQLVRRYASSNIVIKLPDGKRQEVSRAALGAEVQRVRLNRLMGDLRDPTSALRRHLASSPPKGAVKLPVPVTLNPDRAIPTLLSLKGRVDRPASDARLDLDSRKLVPEQAGIELDVHGTYARLVDAVREGADEIDAVVSRIEPRRKADQLGNVQFDQVLGWFETNYARGEKHALRTFNLRLAASRVDGYVILPGEVFDFNEVVGPRDEAHGYKDAPVIAEGELVDGIGGGTCQISGTLHAASFFAGLEVVSRRPHTRPSSYIKMGLDAAVSYPTISLKLKNNFDFPVVVHETVKNGIVRAEILGPRRTLTVTYVRKIVKVDAYEQVERPDPKLPAGVRVLSQRGIPGFRIQKYRIVRDGPFAERQESTDTYPPTTQIIRVGTGDMPKDQAKDSDDPHPEYVADEYLVITQGPGIINPTNDDDDPSGSMVERRTPGYTGVRGWTEKMGFPLWRGNDEQTGDDACDSDDCKAAASKKKGDKKPKDEPKKTDKKKDKKPRRQP
jgi:vancomycin resistance protein YoaR